MTMPWKECGVDNWRGRRVSFRCGNWDFVRDVFIETGTQFGHTTAWARHCGFNECHTIDIDPQVIAKARQLFADEPRIHVHEGDSREVLPRIIDPVYATTFWLDAHHFGGLESYLRGTQCPIVDELAIILATPWVSMPFIMIDDWADFSPQRWDEFSKEHATFRREDWPHSDVLIEMLSPRYSLSLYANIMYCFPKG